VAAVFLAPVVALQILVVGLDLMVELVIPFVCLYGCACLVGRVTRHKPKPTGFIPRDAMSSPPL
jgi:hypothetical protein